MAASNHLDPVAEQSPLVKAIRAYEQHVLHHRVRPQLGQCPRCECPVDAPVFFRLHEIRRRTFLVVVRDVVCTILSLITRWKCARCQRTFTWRPAFAAPHKRYVLPVILDWSRAYVETDEQSYRRGVQDRGKPVFHEQPEHEQIRADSSEEDKAKEGTAALAHTTLYRWISTLGAWRHTLRRACSLIKQKHPATGLFRDVAGFRVAEGKFRSQARQRVLHACRSLCVTEGTYAAVFGVSIFPNLATPCHWT